MQGVGSLLHDLGGGSENDPEKFYGRKIVAATVGGDRLRLEFEDGEKIAVWDDGQSCCESRYMTCDDDLGVLVGGTLRKIEVKELKVEQGEYGDEHEIAFLEIATDSGFITVATHNEHNGYYGGFGLTITKESE